MASTELVLSEPILICARIITGNMNGHYRTQFCVQCSMNNYEGKSSSINV